jgi:hypothetical protein
VFGGSRLVPKPDLPSREVTAPCRVSVLITLAPLLVRRSPLALHLKRLGFRVFTYQAPGKTKLCSQAPLLGFGSSSEVAQAPSRRLEAPVSQSLRTLGATQASISGASREVLTPSACPRPEQRHDWVEPALLDRQRLQVFTTSWRFIRPEPAGLVSCRIRSWDRPPELCSSRAAARRFQRPSPLDVKATRNERPRPQGFSPRESPPPNSAF